MPITGAVVTLSEDEAEAEAAARDLRGHPAIVVGPARGLRLPVVLDTDTQAEHDALWAAIDRTPGVMMVELAFADFSDVTHVDVPASYLRRGRGGTPRGDHGAT